MFNIHVMHFIFSHIRNKKVYLWSINLSIDSYTLSETLIPILQLKLLKQKIAPVILFGNSLSLFILLWLGFDT